MNTGQLDRLWQEQMKAFDHASDTAAYWDGRARTFESTWRKSDYPEELISRMVLKPEYSVLDLACGMGTVAIPIAKRVARVTALDISPSMLEGLRRKIKSINLTNMTIVNKDWNEVNIKEDIEAHDVVLVSRSLPGNQLSETLSKLNLAASQACYITWRTERSDRYECEVAEVMGKKIRSYPDFNIIYETALSMGIAAKLDIFESTSEERFPNMLEAVVNMSRGAELTETQKVKLTEIAGKRLTFQDNAYCSKYKMKWSLISWNKDL
jgi:SAM-dependent methyltransferase